MSVQISPCEGAVLKGKWVAHCKVWGPSAVSCAKTRVGSRKQYGAHWRNLANTTEPSACRGNAAICQITLVTCLYVFVSKNKQMPCQCLKNTYGHGGLRHADIIVITVHSSEKYTSGYAMVVHGRPQTPKNTSFLGGSPSPQGSYSPYILGDTTRPGHVTCVLV